VLGIRLDCRSHRAASGRSARVKARATRSSPSARERVEANRRRPGCLRLARWKRPMGPHGPVLGSETGNWVLAGERHSDSRSSLALARGRKEAKTASGSETGRSRQRVSEVLRQLRTWSTTPRRGGESPTPRGYDRRDRSSSRGVNRRGTRVERAARRERRSRQAERPCGGEARRKPRARELSEFRVLVKEVSCRSRWKYLLRARSASRRGEVRSSTRRPLIRLTGEWVSEASERVPGRASRVSKRASNSLL